MIALKRAWMIAVVGIAMLGMSGCDPLCLFQPNCW